MAFLTVTFSRVNESRKKMMLELGESAPGDVSLAENVDLVLERKEWAELQLMTGLLKPLYSFTHKCNHSASVSSDA